MSRYIDADVFKSENARLLHCDFPYLSEETLEELIDNAPTIDIDAITESHEKIGYDKGFRDGYAQATSEVRHGHWIESKGGGYIGYPIYECSECGCPVGEDASNYCPNCGCKMGVDINGTD